MAREDASQLFIEWMNEYAINPQSEPPTPYPLPPTSSYYLVIEVPLTLVFLSTQVFQPISICSPPGFSVFLAPVAADKS